MDEIGSIVADAIARRIKAARAEQAKNAQAAAANPQTPQAKGLAALARRAQYGDKAAQSILAKLQGAVPAGAPVATPPVRPAVAVTPVAPALPSVAMADVAPLADGFDLDALPGLPTMILEGMAVERPLLLTGFTKAGILPAIVLAEALAKPLALREGGQGDSF